MNLKMTIFLLNLSFLFVACGTTTDSSKATTSTSTSTTSQTNTNAVDITNSILTTKSANCKDYLNSYSSLVKDIQEDKTFSGSLDIELKNTKCNFSSNSIPNHNFNDSSAHFATKVSENTLNYSITASPTFASSSTSLALGANAIMLNGVKLDLLAAGCYGVGDGKIGCHNISTAFRYDPMSSNANFGTDEHNAHTQPNGAYHYHGTPNALFDNNQTNSIESPVIGFASDGFPIFGLYYKDSNNVIQKATSSYTLKTGTRVSINGVNPGGSYDGTYRDDYEYQAASGVLDECNGMTLNGVYGYYVTESYPWIINCFKGTPDSSFNN